MGNGRLGLPDPRPEGLLAHARKIASIARRATDSVNGSFLIEKTETQYIFAIEAFDSKHRAREAVEARAELEQFRTESGFILHAAPLLLERSAFRSAFDSLAASREVGQFFNGTDNIDEIVALARRRMENPDRLAAAEDATKAATCMLWRVHREEETIILYNEYTDVLVKDIIASINKDILYLVEARSKIARRRLLLTGRKDEARQLLATVYNALKSTL
ncbi:MAG: hypothetical protein ACLQK4_08970 [Acidimicrobiales bacterium]|jgi:hypothetical protein